MRDKGFLRLGFVTGLLITAAAAAAFAQQPISQAGQAQSPSTYVGRPTIPNLNAAQTEALNGLNAELSSLVQALATARSQLVAASLTVPTNAGLIRTRAEGVRMAEQSLAMARAGALTRIQASPGRLATEQISSLAATGGVFRPFSGTVTGGAFIPNMSADQTTALANLSTSLAPQTQALTAARTALAAASFELPRNDPAIVAAVDAVRDAELALAQARATAFASFQATPTRLNAEQIAAFTANNGTFRSGAFTEPQPIDFNDHEGYVPLFDGLTLDGWDGNRKFWRVENGLLIGESTPENPSGNSYITFRGIEARDFDLKVEIKVEGTGGTGIQYRTHTGLPWLANISPAVTANVGPVNLDWMATGPQADFWPSTPVWTGQFYSENTPMRVLAWRGQVVEGYGPNEKRLMGTIGDRMTLANVVRNNDWNEYTIIVRGGTFIHILNGQLMAVMIDDDPNSNNNQSGFIGFEIEATTKVSVRSVWLKKLN